MNSDAEAQPSQKYLETLLLYYEEEIVGEAYFYGLADRLIEADQKKKMVLMGDVERHAANAVRPLLNKYGLTPRTDKVLHALGQEQAASGSGNWAESLDEMRKTFPGYVDDFLNLEAMALKMDLTLLQFLTEHERAAIEFLDKELTDRANSADPLLAYIKSTPEGLAAVKQA